jgi:hypothetical protein
LLNDSTLERKERFPEAQDSVERVLIVKRSIRFAVLELAEDLIAADPSISTARPMTTPDAR